MQNSDIGNVFDANLMLMTPTEACDLGDTDGCPEGFTTLIDAEMEVIGFIPTEGAEVIRDLLNWAAKNYPNEEVDSKIKINGLLVAVEKLLKTDVRHCGRPGVEEAARELMAVACVKCSSCGVTCNPAKDEPSIPSGLCWSCSRGW